MLKLSQQYVPIFADVAVEKEWAGKHAVTNIPAVVYTEPDGEAWAKSVGGDQDVLADMRRVLQELEEAR